VHRAELSRYVSTSPTFDSALDFFRSAMQPLSDPQIAGARAYALIDRGLNQQAVIYSYVDDLRYIAVVCVICIPIVFCLKKAKAKSGAAPAAH
jgi:hypothetical protein